MNDLFQKLSAWPCGDLTREWQILSKRCALFASYVQIMGWQMSDDTIEILRKITLRPE